VAGQDLSQAQVAGAAQHNGDEIVAEGVRGDVRAAEVPRASFTRNSTISRPVSVVMG